MPICGALESAQSMGPLLVRTMESTNDGTQNPVVLQPASSAVLLERGLDTKLLMYVMTWSLLSLFFWPRRKKLAVLIEALRVQSLRA